MLGCSWGAQFSACSPTCTVFVPPCDQNTAMWLPSRWWTWSGISPQTPSLSPFLFRNKCTSLVQSDLQTTHISDSAVSPGASPPTLLSVLFNSLSFVNLNTHVLIGAQFMSQWARWDLKQNRSANPLSQIMTRTRPQLPQLGPRCADRKQLLPIKPTQPGQWLMFYNLICIFSYWSSVYVNTQCGDAMSPLGTGIGILKQRRGKFEDVLCQA